MVESVLSHWFAAMPNIVSTCCMGGQYDSTRACTEVEQGTRHKVPGTAVLLLNVAWGRVHVNWASLVSPAAAAPHHHNHHHQHQHRHRRWPQGLARRSLSSRILSDHSVFGISTATAAGACAADLGRRLLLTLSFACWTRAESRSEVDPSTPATSHHHQHHNHLHHTPHSHAAAAAASFVSRMQLSPTFLSPGVQRTSATVYGTRTEFQLQTNLGGVAMFLLLEHMSCANSTQLSLYLKPARIRGTVQQYTQGDVSLSPV